MSLYKDRGCRLYLIISTDEETVVFNTGANITPPWPPGDHELVYTEISITYGTQFLHNTRIPPCVASTLQTSKTTFVANH